MATRLGQTVLSESEIRGRVCELGAQITRDYTGRELLLVGILNGAAIFLVDLARCIDIPVSFDFMAVSSYGACTKSSGIVRIIKDLEENVEGKHLLIVEDIVDSGLTLRYILEHVKARGPASVKVCTLLSKARDRGEHPAVDYTGFVIPDRFVVGYGLDAGGLYRNLPYLAEIETDGAEA